MATYTPADWPVPPITSETKFFWDGVVAGELRIQQCTDCHRLQHPPRASCSACQSLTLGHEVVSGRGTVFSYAIHHRPAVPGPERPYTSIIVDLDEGVRFLSNLVDAPQGEVRVGLPVRVSFRRVNDSLILPLFVCADSVNG